MKRQSTFGNVWPLRLKLDGDDFGVHDVYGAAVLCYSIFRLVEADYLSLGGLARRMARAVTGRLSAKLASVGDQTTGRLRHGREHMIGDR